MHRIVSVLSAVALLGCTSPIETAFKQNVEALYSYKGYPAEDLIADIGPPSKTKDAGAGRQTLLFEIVAKNGMFYVLDEPSTLKRECWIEARLAPDRTIYYTYISGSLEGCAPFTMLLSRKPARPTA